MPSILSATVMICIFKNFSDFDLRYLIIEKTQDMAGYDTTYNILSIYNVKTYITVVLFDIFIGFGTTTLIYTNKMSEISPEIYEAAKLDGISPIREFFNIALPFSYPTLSTFLVTSMAGIFTNQYNLFTFFASDLGTLKPGPIGYIIYNSIQQSAAQGIYDSPAFHETAALGIVCTLVIIPIVFGGRFLLEKFGPKEN